MLKIASATIGFSVLAGLLAPIVSSINILNPAVFVFLIGVGTLGAFLVLVSSIALAVALPVVAFRHAMNPQTRAIGQARIKALLGMS